MISPTQWVPAGGLTLEPNALRAAKARVRNLALTAGPGAGKTEMLAQRADFLLRTGVCPYPKRILAISFKTDASRNLKNRVLLRCGETLASRFDSYTFHAFAKRLIDKFRVVLAGADALDYDYKIGDERIPNKQIRFADMLPLARKIIANCPAAARSIRATYSDVFLDEFQDCNNDQYQLIRELFQGTGVRLTSVGDTKQKIMSFAGAMEGIFRTFAADFNAVPLNMYRNFRSKPRLLRMQNKIIARMDPESVMADDLVAGTEGEVSVLRFENAEDEAEKIALDIKSWIEVDSIPPWEIAVIISRQIAQYGHSLIECLARHGVPFRNEHEVQDDLSNPVIEVFIDYLRVLAGENCPESYLRLNQFVDADPQSEWIGRQNHNRWDEFFRVERTAFAGEDGIDQRLLMSYLKRFVNHVGKPKFHEICSYTGYTLTECGLRVKPILRAASASDLPLHVALGNLSHSESVKILTVHKSKGLEFHSVVFIGIEDQTFWGKPFSNERCAFFVGISRAKRRLVLTTANRRVRPPGMTGMWNEARSAQEEFLGYAED